MWRKSASICLDSCSAQAAIRELKVNGSSSDDMTETGPIKSCARSTKDWRPLLDIMRESSIMRASVPSASSGGDPSVNQIAGLSVFLAFFDLLLLFKFPFLFLPEPPLGLSPWLLSSLALLSSPDPARLPPPPTHIISCIFYNNAHPPAFSGTS